MRIILDTEKGRIIADSGSDKKWTAQTYVQDQFDKAMKETMLRAEDKVVK